MTLWPLAMAAVAATAAAPLVGEMARKPVTRRTSNDPNGQFADLPRGRVYYRWHGPNDGPVAICVHGLTTPSYVWDGLIPHLVDRGFRVLSFDLYGRGYSDRPFGPQDVDFYQEILTALLHDQQVSGPVTLIGNSMGSAIATAYAARRPARIRQLVLFVPAGMGHDLGVAARITQKLPVLGDWLFHLSYPRVLRTGAEAERDMPGFVANIADRQIEELQFRGFLRSVLSSLRSILAELRESDHRRIQNLGLPVLCIWGEDDNIIPIACKDRLSGWNADADHIVLPDAGHGLVYTHTDLLWPLLAAKLRTD